LKRPVRGAVITVSTSRAPDNVGDESGDRLVELVGRLGLDLAGRELIADDRALIEERLCHWADAERCELVLTSGGTGVAPDDVTPDATRTVIEREVPGIAEALREASRPYTRYWMLSRGAAGIRGSSLIINLPGSPASIVQAGATVAEAIPHALELIAGRRPAHD
jgi:molybdenum cofactor synthesis domain-containing protein